MTDVENRLRKCFEAVFHKLRYDEIPSATMGSIQEWDSASTVMLVAVIEEEFGFQVELDALESLLSFRSALEYLENVGGISDRPDAHASAASDSLDTDREQKMTWDR